MAGKNKFRGTKFGATMQPGTKLANPTAEESKEEDEEVVSLAEKMFGDKRPSVDT